MDKGAWGSGGEGRWEQGGEEEDAGAGRERTGDTQVAGEGRGPCLRWGGVDGPKRKAAAARCCCRSQVREVQWDK